MLNFAFQTPIFTMVLPSKEGLSISRAFQMSSFLAATSCLTMQNCLEEQSMQAATQT